MKILTSKNLKGVKEYYEFFLYKDWTPDEEDMKKLPHGWETYKGEKGAVVERSDEGRQAFILNHKMNREWYRAGMESYKKNLIPDSE